MRFGRGSGLGRNQRVVGARARAKAWLAATDDLCPQTYLASLFTGQEAVCPEHSAPFLRYNCRFCASTQPGRSFFVADLSVPPRRKKLGRLRPWPLTLTHPPHSPTSNPSLYAATPSLIFFLPPPCLFLSYFITTRRPPFSTIFFLSPFPFTLCHSTTTVARSNVSRFFLPDLFLLYVSPLFFSRLLTSPLSPSDPIDPTAWKKLEKVYMYVAENHKRLLRFS